MTFTEFALVWGLGVAAGFVIALPLAEPIERWALKKLKKLRQRRKRPVVKLRAKDLHPLAADIRINGDDFVIIHTREHRPGSYTRLTIELAERDLFYRAHTAEIPDA